MEARIEKLEALGMPNMSGVSEANPGAAPLNPNLAAIMQLAPLLKGLFGSPGGLTIDEKFFATLEKVRALGEVLWPQSRIEAAVYEAVGRALGKTIGKEFAKEAKKEVKKYED